MSTITILTPAKQQAFDSPPLFTNGKRVEFFMNNQEFSQAMKEDQEITIGCGQLMQNTIVLWNYLILSQQLLRCKTTAEKNNVLAIIQNGSILTWGHINMQGEYDFLTYLASNDPYFKLEAISTLKIS
jgi:hypothetical protein